MQTIRSKLSLAAGAFALAALCQGGSVQAQTNMPMAGISNNVMKLPTSFHPGLLQAHQADLEAMIGDLSRVQTPAAAKEYEPYLAAQLPKYVANHHALHHGAMPGFLGQKHRLGGSELSQQQAMADATDKLSESHFPKVASEMDRVERLNPGLKKSFDTLRNLD